jgi:hypothetical protein
VYVQDVSDCYAITSGPHKAQAREEHITWKEQRCFEPALALLLTHLDGERCRKCLRSGRDGASWLSVQIHGMWHGRAEFRYVLPDGKR